jgi:rhodanese-related sulfurtransferase
MTALLWGLAIVAAAIGVWVVRRMLTLQREINQLKRDHYYTSSRLKQVPEEIREAVQPVRLHLAKVAEGGAVPRHMILDGRLYQDVSAKEAQQVWEREATLRPDQVMFVDVRTPKEFATRRVPGARLVPFDELETRYQGEIPYTAEKVVVYCASGERSRFACDFLSHRGYTNLYHVTEGLQGWQGPTEGEGQLSLMQIQRKATTISP